MSQYASLAALKEAIGDPDTADDGVLTSALVRASGIIDTYLASSRPGYVGIAAGSNFSSAVGSNTRIYHGNGSDTLFIDDAMSVSSVVVDDVTIDTASYVAEPLNRVPKRWLTYNLPTSSLYGLRPSVWSPGTGNVEVTGYWGLNFIPDDIQQVAIALAILIWNRYQMGKPMVAWGPADAEVVAILDGLDGWRLPSVYGA